MKYFISLCILFYSVLMLIILGGCSNGNDVAGTGSSTGNAKIAGVILSEDGTPASNSVVYLIPDDYNPIENRSVVEIRVDTADSEGFYSFEMEDTLDSYNVDAMGITGNFRYFKSGLTPSFDESNENLDTGFLMETGVLKVILSGDFYDSSDGYLYIPGTRVTAKISSFFEYDNLNYTIYIDSVPAASYDLLQYDRLDTSFDATPVIDSIFSVEAMDTATLGTYQIIPVFDPGVFGAVKQSNVVVENAIIKLVPTEYDPVNGDKINDSLIDTTDNNGMFTIRLKDSTALYNLIIESGSSSGYYGTNISFTHDSLNPVAYDLSNNGYLKIILQDKYTDTAGGYLFVPGTDISVDLSDYAEFDQVNYTYLISVKVGDYDKIINANDDGDVVSTLFDTPFKITAEDTTVLGEAAPLIFNFSSQNSELPSNLVYSVGTDPYGGIWFGTHSGEFIRYTANDTSEQWKIFKAADYGVHSSILSIATDKSDGTMWFGTHGAVISLTPSISDQQSLLKVYDPITSMFPGGSVYSIAVDNSNVKWFGSYTQGIVSYDGFSWTRYNPATSNIPSAYTYDIAIDGSNTKWVASRGGVSSFNGISWTTYNKTNSNLDCDTVFCIDVDVNGTVWAGFYNGSAASFDGNNWTVYTSSNSPLSSNAVNSVAVDLDGVKWFGADNGQLLSYDDSEWKDYSSYLPDSTERLLDIEIDTLNNKWVTTETAGVVLIDHTVK